MATVCLSSIQYLSNNQELLTYILSFKNIKVLLNPVIGRPLAYKATLMTDILSYCIGISILIQFESDWSDSFNSSKNASSLTSLFIL